MFLKKISFHVEISYISCFFFKKKSVFRKCSWTFNLSKKKNPQHFLIFAIALDYISNLMNYDIFITTSQESFLINNFYLSFLDAINLNKLD